MFENIIKLQGWKIDKIPNLLFYQEGPGVRNNQYTQTGVKLLNVANLQNGQVVLENTERYISEDEAYGRYSHFLVDEGDLIIASSGIKVEYFDKKMGFIKKEHLPLCMNTSTIRFKTLNQDILDLKYFSYFLKTNFFKKQIARLITGSAQLNFGPSHLKQIDVIVPPLYIQNSIVNVLDKAQELIDKRKEQIEALDELVKSKFIEMFGDPVQNPLGWELKPFLDSGNCKNGMNFSADEIGVELQYLGVGDFKNLSQIYNVNNLGKVSLNKMPSKDYILQDGDIVFVRSNGNKDLVGRCLAVYPNGVPTTYSGFCIRYRKTDENLEIPYLLQVLKTDSIRKNMAGRGANIQNLNQQILGQLMIPVPPIELQNQFVDFVKRVDELKLDVEKSLKELEDNFNSLMQRTFKGELFN